MDQQSGPHESPHFHVCYSPNCQRPPSQAGDSAGPLCFPHVRQCHGPCAACAVDAGTGSGFAGAPRLEGFGSERFPDDIAQLYVGPVQRGYIDHPIPWASVPFGWSDMVPAASNAHTAIDDSNFTLSTPNMNLILVPLRLEQVSTDLFIITQTNYDCSQPFPTTALSQPCAYSQFHLSSANANDFEPLSCANEVAFLNVTFGQKISFRLRVIGRPPYDRQVNLPRAGRNKSSPARATLATLVAKEIKRFVDYERENRRPLMHLGKAITLDDLCLVELRHVSRASIQPVIGLVATGL